METIDLTCRVPDLKHIWKTNVLLKKAQKINNMYVPLGQMSICKEPICIEVFSSHEISTYVYKTFQKNVKKYFVFTVFSPISWHFGVRVDWLSLSQTNVLGLEWHIWNKKTYYYCKLDNYSPTLELRESKQW